jgi:hypothetical protein
MWLKSLIGDLKLTDALEMIDEEETFQIKKEGTVIHDVNKIFSVISDRSRVPQVYYFFLLSRWAKSPRPLWQLH